MILTLPSNSIDLSFSFLYRNYGLRYMYLVHSSSCSLGSTIET